MARNLMRRCLLSVVVLTLGLAPNAGAGSGGRVDAAASPAASSGWHSLTGLVPNPANISSGWKISPDSSTVVFVSDKDTQSVSELFSVSISGTAPVKLNPALVGGGDVRSFGITPDSQYVIYMADQEVQSRVELYRVPIGGGEAVKLSGPMVAGGNVHLFVIDPDNQRVVYRADQNTNEVFELYSVPIAGGGVVKLNPALVTGGDVTTTFRVEPISNRVVYLADQETDGRTELFSVPIAGGQSKKLNKPTTSGVFGFQLNPSTAVLIYAMRTSSGSSEQLYMQAVADAVYDVTLNFPLASNQDVFGYRFSPDGARVVYNVTTKPAAASVNYGNLYSVLIGGGESTLLTEAADPGFGVYGALFAFTPDSQRVVAVYQKSDALPRKLISVTLAGTNREDLYSEAGGQALSTYVVSPDGQWVVYKLADDRLYSLPPSGGAPTQLGTGYQPYVMPDSSRVVFASAFPGPAYDLFSVQIFGGGLRNLSRVGPDAQVTGTPEISADSQWIVYEVEYLSNQGVVARELRASDGSEAPPVYKVYLPALRR